jgi:tungstate transport system substrate-binding protein
VVTGRPQIFGVFAPAALGFVLAVTALTCARPEPALEIATTTSVVNSGLLEYVMPAFPGIAPRIHATGSGRSIAMLGERTVDLAITHSPAAERLALETHPEWAYQKLAYNFVIIGPESDPAGLRSARTAVEAFQKIAAHGSPFVSRGDESGTHERERALWRKANVDTATVRLLISGGSMATTLRQADQQLAYTMSDESTWRQLEHQLQSRLLFGDDPQLLNTYAVIYPRDSDHAAALASFLLSGEGRERISRFRIADRPAFVVWPDRCPGTVPDATLCVGRGTP